ncbi:bi-domain-containing oxidoreductase [Arcicella rosea]|uniref:Putative dehydrogenase/threonine dehydrogenase-like Zn-dependent dehydrogenase n=1 Tax=Arcicella rosea TaxID=502909 RepID=A0A841EUU4_9BACT|nr:bi-domain-containing oxidoreductase [Arcicella rosea]MBB6005149.1 putative dehydrogenase/threonine dehydrogenase-like Zn-dependent dehydrogenase [Arcicella rosea]
MKQIIQHLQTGETILVEIPVPQVRKACVLIKTHRSLVSLGTEKMLVQFGKSNLLSKAQQQPEKVKQVLAKIKTDGFKPTFDAVRRKLNEPIPLGYCNVGEVIAIGTEVSEFKIGDRVVSNGNHAEVVCVPKNLVAIIPDEVSDEEATFTVVGAIALQSIRLVNPTFGETVVVIGLGLIGQLTAELLLANGCEVIAFDFEQSKVDLAISKGIKAFQVKEKDDSLQIAKTLTKQIGVDAVIITASTKSNEVIAQAAQMSRKRGRIVLVGVIGLDIQRADFYEKELSFQVSCSYGAGRYETNYEQNGQDYPIGFVRWTAKRNFEAVLNAIAKKKLQVNSLITQKVAFENFQEIYANMGKSNAIASILEYSEKSFSLQDTIQFQNNTFEKSNDILAIIGAGNFTKSTVLPNLKKLKAKIKYISSSNGLSASLVAQQFGITKATSNNEIIFNDPAVGAVIITTQHNTHAKLCIQALKAGKHVFVEKPLALTQEEIDEIIEVYQQSGKTLTVGFNRRFSPFIQDAKKQLGSNNLPMNVIATMNAGCIPSTHWTQDMSVGGGRIIGEACHLIDLISFITGSLVESVVMNAMEQSPSLNTDNATILLKYQNGSTGVINYFSNGHKSYSKERIEIYSQGRTIIVDNFRKSIYYGFKNSGFSQSQDKGHFQQFKLWLERLKNGGEAIIPFEEIINISKASIEAVSSLVVGKIMFI